jgi:hypothetical protein
MPLVNIRKKIPFFFDFCQNFNFRTFLIFAVTEHTRNQIFFWQAIKIFFFLKMLTLVLFDGFLQ